MLREKANIIRAQSLKAIHAGRSGHPGGCLSLSDILAVLYFDELNVDPENPDWLDRDRFVLSKGHSCPAHYCALAERGFFSREEVLGLRKIGSRMEGHPSAKIPGVDAVSGSLGMGLSQGIGMALGARYQSKAWRTYVVLGDGDMQEGNTWEALMLAPHQRLDNLVAIYDSNKLQGDAPVSVQLDLGDVRAKLESFGWHVIDVDGHDVDALQQALAEARNVKGKPSFLIADTVKGKGVSFMEGVLRWHGSVTMTDKELDDSLAELAGGPHETS